MANLSNINNILRTGSLGVGINRDPLGAFEISSATKPGIKMFNTAASGKTYEAYSDINGNYIIFDQDANDNRFVINTSGNATFAGNVTLSDGKMQISGPALTDNYLKINVANVPLQNGVLINYAGASQSTGLFINQPNGGGSGAADYALLKVNNQGTNPTFYSSNNGSTPVIIKANGNVGIGTASPDAQLELKKETTWGTLNNQVLYINNTGTGGNTGLLHDMGSITWRSGNVNTAAISGIRNTPASGNNVDLRFTTATQSGGQQTSMTILSGGNVGIGTTTPGGLLTVSGSVLQNSNNPGIEVSNSHNSQTVLLINNTTSRKYELAVGGSANGIGNGSFYIYDATAASSRFVINSSGNIGIGATSPQGKLQITTGDSGASSAWTNADELILESSGNAGLAFQTPNTGAATIAFQDPESVQAGFIQYLHADNALRFATNGNNERMRITSGGNVEFKNGQLKVGDSTTAELLIVPSSDGFAPALLQFHKTDTASQTVLQFLQNNIQKGSITYSGSSTSFNTTSDYRLKEDLQDFAGLDMVSKIPVYDFKWKTDESRSYGVMAHELQEVLPDAVSGEKDDEQMQGVDYSKIVPFLIKSIQELKADNDSLKARIETLENN